MRKKVAAPKIEYVRKDDSLGYLKKKKVHAFYPICLMQFRYLILEVAGGVYVVGTDLQGTFTRKTRNSNFRLTSSQTT